MECCLLQECITSENGSACRGRGGGGGQRHILPRNVSLTPKHSLGILGRKLLITGKSPLSLVLRSKREQNSHLVLSSVLSYCRHFVPTAVLMLDSRVTALPGCSLTLAHSPRRSSLRPCLGKNWAALPSKLDPVSVCSFEQERLICHLFWKTCPALLNGGRKFRKCALCPGHPQESEHTSAWGAGHCSVLQRPAVLSDLGVMTGAQAVAQAAGF